MKMKAPLFLGLLLTSLSPALAQGAPEIWFSPNYKTKDYFALLDSPDQWRQARSKISIFKVYPYQMYPGCPGSCLDGKRGDQLIAKLKEWNIALAFETGAIKEHTCRGAVAAAAVLDAIKRVEAKGGAVKWISMDEPLNGGQHVWGGKTCGMTPDAIAKETAIYIKTLRDARPGIKVGDIEAYPAYNLAKNLEFIQLLTGKYGAKLDFFHWDVDPNALKNKRVTTLRADLAALRADLGKRGIPFGLIFWGNSKNTDCDYYNKTQDWTKQAKAALVGRPEHIIFQSWTHSVPTNLPETGSVPSHTRILNEGLNILTGVKTDYRNLKCK